jgi:hypothetical protein
MAVSQDKGMVSIATADGKDTEWPFVPGVQYRAFDFTSGTWYCVYNRQNEKYIFAKRKVHFSRFSTISSAAV